MKYLILLIPLLLLVGCQHDELIPPIGTVDRTMTDYAFIDISDDCELFHDYNISLNSSPCSAGKNEYMMFHTEEYNWSIMCCEFSGKCSLNNNTIPDNLCAFNSTKYNGYVFNDNGYWLAQCCNAAGSSCYVDLYINVNDSSTVCDEDYKQNLYGVNYLNNTWESMCCIGGLEE